MWDRAKEEKGGKRKAKQDLFPQGEMLQRAQAATEVLAQDQADNPLSRKRTSKRI